LEFKEHLETFGYHPFVKTTARKGLHVLTPIELKWGFHEAFEAAKAVAQPFVDAHPSALTLQIKKDYRAGKVLLIFTATDPRRPSSPPTACEGFGAPVSTPLHWEELASLESSQAFDLQSVPQRVIENGDPGKRWPPTPRQFIRRFRSDHL
jgi:DNA primase